MPHPQPRPDPDPVEERLLDLLAEWHARRAAGAAPTPEELTDDPELRERLRARIAAAERFEVATPADPSTGGGHSSPTQADAPPAPPGFRILRELGRGGMGVVYEAVQERPNRPVAIKVVPGRAGREAVRRFLAEAEAAAAVRHPHVVQVHEVGEVAGRPYLVMEYLPGGTLAGRLATAGRFTPEAAARTLAQIARGVAAAHAAGVVHRDLKPGNVLFDARGTPRVADFGLAKRADSDLTATGTAMGTPAYMAPEQARNAKEVGPPADVWALGVMLYECLTGRRPFAADEPVEVLRRVLDEEPAPPRSVVREVPRDLDTVCRKCLSKGPADRYPSAAELADDLDRFLAGEPVAARPIGLARRVGRRLRRHPRTAVAALASAAALVALAVWATTASFGQREARQQTALADRHAELVAKLTPSGWSPALLAERFDETDAAVEALARDDPDRAAELRRRWVALVGEKLHEAAADARHPDDLARFQAVRSWLAGRDPEAARRFTETAAANLKLDWVPVVEFPGAARPAGDVFAAAGPGWRNAGPARVLVTHAPCQGDVRFEATLDLAGVADRQLGLLLDTRAPELPPARVGMTADGRVVLAEYPTRVKIWHADSGRFLDAFPGDALAFDGRFVYTADAQGVWKLDAGSGQRHPFLPARAGRDLRLAPSPDGLRLAVAYRVAEKTVVELWDAEARTLVRSWDWSAAVTTLVASADGRVFASDGNHAVIWAADREQPVGEHTFGEGAVRSAAFAADGPGVLVNGAAVLRHWTPHDGRDTPVFDHCGAYGHGLAVRGGACAVSGVSGVAFRFGPDDGWERLPIDHAGATTCVGFGPTGQLLAGGADGTVSAFDLAARRVRLRLGLPGLAFLLTSPDRSLGELAKQGGRLRLDLLRDGVPLADRTVTVGAGEPRVRLRVERVGGRVECSASRGQALADPILFRDPAPYADRASDAFGLVWPVGAQLTDVRADRKRVPDAAGPLARGDRAYADGNFAEAREEYRQQAQAAGDRPRVRLEAQYKMALCAAALKNPGEAEELLRATVRGGAVAGEDAAAWVLPAAVRLWGLLLDQNRRPEADDVFREVVAPGRTQEALAARIPRSELAAVRDHYLTSGPKFQLLYDPAGLVASLETADRVFDLLRAEPTERLAVWQRLVEGYWMRRQDREAGELVTRMLAAARELPLDTLGEGVFLTAVGRFSWHRRASGDPAAALAAVDEALARPDVRRPGSAAARQGLWLERARCLVALRDLPAAAEAVREFDAARPPSQTPYALHAYARMLLGFALADQGKAEEARAAWRSATFAAWSGGRGSPAALDQLPAEERVKAVMAAALAGTLSPADVDRFFDGLVAEATTRTGGQAFSAVEAFKLVRLPAADYLAVAAGDRGRAAIRHVVLQDVPFRDSFLLPGQLLAEETIARQVGGDPLTDEQRGVVRDLVAGGVEAFHRGELDKGAVLTNAAPFWQGAVAARFVSQPTSGFPASLKPAAAYVFALRAERSYQDRKKARALYTEARDGAPAGSPLRRLAEAGLSRVGAN